MKEDESQALLELYRSICADHCTPYFLLEKLTDCEFECDWGDKSLSNLINLKTSRIGCIPCNWMSYDANNGKALLKELLSISLLCEYPPFGKQDENEVNAFINRLFNLVGDGCILTNRIKYENSSSFDGIFPEDDRYVLDMGVAIITGEWFVFIAHRGFD
jgi:hypothetical protein